MLKLLLIFLFTTVSFSDELKVGLSYLKFDYVETNQDDNFLYQETSGFNDIDGIILSYRYDIGKLDKNHQINSLKLEVKYNEDETTNDNLSKNIKNKLFEPKLTLQRTTYTKNYDVGLFASYGMRDWTRDISINPNGIKKIYNWKFYDIGIDIKAYDGAWEIGLQAAYQKAIDPIMDAYLNSETRFNLGDTKGHYYKIPLGYNINKNLKLELEYEYNEWNIEKSNTVNNTYEPQSETKNKYLYLNVVYRF